ncbi:VOC family protein [uncultured Gimesia sp.]|uniref:VOC family protein n=1 Tax=uncultured Gimesia sp. TaxID=1678688 RepID=UPI0030DA29F6
MQQTVTAIRELVPLLIVEDLSRSADFYCDQLGFEMKLKWEPEGKLAWCRLERNNTALMLQLACADEDGTSEERCKGVGFFFHCDDAQAIYEELSAQGISLEPPKVAFYGMNQLFMKDPDGYELCFQNQVEKPEEF